TPVVDLSRLINEYPHYQTIFYELRSTCQRTLEVSKSPYPQPFHISSRGRNADDKVMVSGTDQCPLTNHEKLLVTSKDGRQAFVNSAITNSRGHQLASKAGGQQDWPGIELSSSFFVLKATLPSTSYPSV